MGERTSTLERRRTSPEPLPISMKLSNILTGDMSNDAVE
jgi:hypothetical protein